MNLSFVIDGLFPKPTHVIGIGNLSEDDIKRLKLLGTGACRNVYDYSPEFVLKVDRNRKEKHRASFYNRNEWQFWESIKHSPVAKYFFSVVDFDQETHFLLMERAVKQPQWGAFAKDKQYEKFMKIVNALNVGDISARNVGYKSDGTLACLDYGFQEPVNPKNLERAEALL